MRPRRPPGFDQRTRRRYLPSRRVTSPHASTTPVQPFRPKRLPATPANISEGRSKSNWQITTTTRMHRPHTTSKCSTNLRMRVVWEDPNHPHHVQRPRGVEAAGQGLCIVALWWARAHASITQIWPSRHTFSLFYGQNYPGSNVLLNPLDSSWVSVWCESP